MSKDNRGKDMIALIKLLAMAFVSTISFVVFLIVKVFKVIFHIIFPSANMAKPKKKRTGYKYIPIIID